MPSAITVDGVFGAAMTPAPGDPAAGITEEAVPGAKGHRDRPFAGGPYPVD